MSPLNTSFIFSLFKKIYKVYLFLAKVIGKIFRHSQTYRLGKIFYEGTKISFKYSFIARVTDEEGSFRLNFGDSKLMCWALEFWKYKILHYWGLSVFASSVLIVRKKLRFFSLQSIGLIIFVATLTNIFLSVLFIKKITALDWVMKIVVLFIGLAGLTGDVHLADLEKASFALSKINKKDCKT